MYKPKTNLYLFDVKLLKINKKATSTNRKLSVKRNIENNICDTNIYPTILRNIGCTKNINIKHLKNLGIN